MSAQSMSALGLANSVRSGRSVVRRAIETDNTRFDQATEAIVFPPECCESLRVIELLRWVPGVNTLRGMEACARARVGEGRRLGDLTDRERSALVAALRAA